MKSQNFVFLLIILLAACTAPTQITRDALTPTVAPTIAKLNDAITLASGQNVRDVAVDDANVYWSDCGTSSVNPGGRVMRVAKTGGDAIALASNQMCPSALALDAANVYWLGGTSSARKILRMAKTGGAVTTLVDGGDIRAFGADGTTVYWTTCDVTRGTGAVLRVPKTGGVPEKFVATKSCANDLAVDSETIFWIDDDGVMKLKTGGTPAAIAPAQFHPRGLGLDDTSAYWIADTYILRVAKAGGTPAVIVSDQRDLGAIAVDADNVYWSGQSALFKIAKTGGIAYTVTNLDRPASSRSLVVDDANVYWANQTAIQKTAKAGGVPVVANPNVPTTLAIAQEGITSIAMDEANVYWTTCRYEPEKYPHGRVMRVAKAGGTPVILAADQLCPQNIAVDAAQVYWINQGAETSPGEYRDGAVMRVAKSGGAASALGSKINGRASLALDEARVYWTDCGTAIGKFEDGAVFAIAQAGGAAEKISAEQKCPGSVAVDATNVYWQSNGTTSGAVSGAIWRTDKRGGAPVLFAAEGGGATSSGATSGAIALDAENVYWTRTTGQSRTTFGSCADERGVLVRAPKAGGAATTLAEFAGLAPVKIALDETSVYWANDCTQGVLRVPKTGGAPATILPNTRADWIGIDAANIFWTNYPNGTVLKKAK